MTTFNYDGWNIVSTLTCESAPSSNADWDIVRPVWGLDLSGSFQGAGGVGGLLGTRRSNYSYWSYLVGGDPTEVARQFPSYDGNGNIIAWTKDDGSALATRDYDAFGNTVSNQGAQWSSATAFGFSTKYEDQETGLLYYGYRYYDPVTGRWPSRDPIGERGGINLYGMVGNDLVNLVDVYGLLGFAGQSKIVELNKEQYEHESKFDEEELKKNQSKKPCKCYSFWLENELQEMGKSNPFKFGLSGIRQWKRKVENGGTLDSGWVKGDPITAGVRYKKLPCCEDKDTKGAHVVVNLFYLPDEGDKGSIKRQNMGFDTNSNNRVQVMPIVREAFGGNGLSDFKNHREMRGHLQIQVKVNHVLCLNMKVEIAAHNNPESPMPKHREKGWVGN